MVRTRIAAPVLTACSGARSAAAILGGGERSEKLGSGSGEETRQYRQLRHRPA